MKDNKIANLEKKILEEKCLMEYFQSQMDKFDKIIETLNDKVDVKSEKINQTIKELYYQCIAKLKSSRDDFRKMRLEQKDVIAELKLENPKNWENLDNPEIIRNKHVYWECEHDGIWQLLNRDDGIWINLKLGKNRFSENWGCQCRPPCTIETYLNSSPDLNLLFAKLWIFNQNIKWDDIFCVKCNSDRTVLINHWIQADSAFWVHQCRDCGDVALKHVKIPSESDWEKSKEIKTPPVNIHVQKDLKSFM